MKGIPHPQSYILRITKEEWFRRVFSLKKYYPGVRRRWEPNAKILLVRNTENGDSFVGYGTLLEYIRKDQLPADEQIECASMRWTGALLFNELYKFDPPLLLKETFLSGSSVRGRCLHGYPLNERQVGLILSRAKGLCNVLKIDDPLG